ncbi:MAG: glycosyltransferase [Chitinophagales bacterium]|nr:glycosyltransferase [Chitinophagales bacterium]
MTHAIILSLLIISLIGIAYYWLTYYFALNQASKKSLTQSSSEPLGVSVIIICKNESQGIKALVNQVLNQAYPRFEVIVVDDFSSDHTLEILQSIADPRLIILSATEDKPGKKSAQTLAINTARHDYILLTDADCIISSNQWIKSMVNSMASHSNYQIALGFSPMIQGSGLLNLFARYETIMTAIQYGARTLIGKPYMAVGRNLMFKKDVFFKVGGHSGHAHIASGDDDLFIQSATNHQNTTINSDPESFVMTEAKGDLISYLNQKSRHISTSVYYRASHQVYLALFVVVQILFYASITWAIILNPQLITLYLLLVLFKWIFQIFCISKWFSIFKSRDLLVWIPMLDMLMMLYYIGLPLYQGLFYKRKW